MLRASGVVKTYPGPHGVPVPVLRGIDLTVKAGELAVITGSSGSGKSTLLNVLGLLEDPDTGDVWFGDDQVSAWSRRAKSRARGRWVGFVFQAFQLLPSRPPVGVPSSSWTRSGWRSGATTILRSSPAVNSSVWRTAGPCSTTRRFSSPTSRLVTSTTTTRR